MGAAQISVPFPTADEELKVPPTADEVEHLARGIAGAVAQASGLTEVQRAVLNAVSESMTGFAVDVASVEPIGPTEFAEGLRYRNAQFRTRITQLMLLAELVLVPLPTEVTARVESYAEALGVADEMMAVARQLAHGSLGLALIDFERSGYFAHLTEQPTEQLHLSRALSDAWDEACNDPELYDRWAALEQCPDGSLGQGVWRFYQARGFTFPGHERSAPPVLAQHDWIHVLADYGSTVESEIEVFGLIARANDDPRGFSLLAMVIGLFETGYLFNAAKGFFAYDRGHLSRDPERMARRLADAMRRGAHLASHLDEHARSNETDLLAVDWFQHANRPVAEVRADFGLEEKSAAAVASGSVTPWEHGGISPFQYECGQKTAAAASRTYDSFGATPPDV
jgi:hypothetical protein